MSPKLTVLGAGAWGTALAVNQYNNGKNVTLWGRNAQDLAAMRDNLENKRYLPDIKLPETLNFEPNIDKAVQGADIVLLVTPAQTISDTVETIKPHLSDKAIIISAAKGIDRTSGRTMSHIIAAHIAKQRTALLSGPSFAIDVVRGLPTAVTVAMDDLDNALALSETLSNKQLRCYASDDLIGVDYGGALKNVLAIAAGIAHGKGLGASAVAALTTRGFAELQRIAMAMGAQPETLSGLSGLGDLILTCASEKSRNFAYGAAIGRGDDLGDLKLAEGVKTASIAAKIAQAHKIDAPLIDAVDSVINGAADVTSMMEKLLTRPIKIENDIPQGSDPK